MLAELRPDKGAIQKGTVVNDGDPLVLVAKKKDTVYGKVHRGRAGNFTNETVTWDRHLFPGHCHRR
jgi:hypothetical protein